ncbi:MAG: cytidylyltransferase domain-containing protein [Polaribacter sp.]
MYNFGIIIQARTSSTRLPKKIILEIEKNLTFLDVLLNRLSPLKKKIPIVLSTSTLEADNVLEKFARKYDIDFFRGSEEDVLDRFIKCSEKYNFNTIIRICSDNPFIDVKLILELLKNYNGEDYLSFKINNTPSILTHFGFFSEIVSLKALKKISEKGNLNCKEHVTNCIYMNKNEFNVQFLNKIIINQNIRCTLDTIKDFLNLKKLYVNLVKKNSHIGYKDIINFIEENSELETNMKLEINENIK